MNKGFTIVEILVVIVIVGIISTVIISDIEGSIEDAQVAVDKIDKAHDSAAEEKCKAFGKLYMIGQSSDSLYELDTEAARDPATKIGERFGVESFPTSITSHNGKLYMVKDSSDSLYVLNTEATGNPATIVGKSFGGQEDTPQSITSHNGKLYMVGQGSDSLYELDTEATEDPATKIGTGFGTGFGGSGQESRPVSITSHNGKLYMVGQGSDSLYELDTEATEDPATKIGTGFGFGGSNQERFPTSITSHNGKLYMIGEGSDSLYELDTEATGKSPATKIGERFGGPRTGDGQEWIPLSITSYNGKLYMVGQSSASLYELDTEATGKSPATIVGTSFFIMETHPTSIAFHCNIYLQSSYFNRPDWRGWRVRV